MNSNSILQTRESISGATQDEVNPPDSSIRALSAQPMAIEVTIAEDVLTLVGLAELTAANSHRFRNKVCAALNGHKVVEIDLAQTTSMDCAGLGALIAIRNLTCSRSGVVRLMNPTSPVRQLLDLTRTGQIFEIVSTAQGPRSLTEPSSQSCG